jgi:cytochrome c5
MNKSTLALFAALSLLVGCGRDEEPAQEPAAPPSSAPPTGAPVEPSPAPLPGESPAPAPDVPATPPATPPSETPATPPSETPATPPSETPAAPQSEAPAAPPGEAASGTASAAAGGGESVYKTTCAVCHAPGVAGAPKLDDSADWSPRIGQGIDVLYTHAVNGYQGQKGVMPPKGGNTALSDEQVRAAVDYMVAQAK